MQRQTAAAAMDWLANRRTGRGSGDDQILCALRHCLLLHAGARSCTLPPCVVASEVRGEVGPCSVGGCSRLSDLRIASDQTWDLFVWTQAQLLHKRGLYNLRHPNSGSGARREPEAARKTTQTGKGNQRKVARTANANVKGQPQWSAPHASRACNSDSPHSPTHMHRALLERLHTSAS